MTRAAPEPMDHNLLSKIVISHGYRSPLDMEFDLRAVSGMPAVRDDFARQVRDRFDGQVDRVLGLCPELATAVASTLKVPMVSPKDDTVPEGWCSRSCEEEDVRRFLAIPPHALSPRDRVLIVEDVRFGGAAQLAVELIQSCDAEVAGLAHLMTLGFPSPFDEGLSRYPRFARFMGQDLVLTRHCFKKPPDFSLTPDLRYKLLALDLDGTLTRPNEMPSPRSLLALVKARHANMATVYCTARLRKELPWAPFTRDLVPYAVLAGGSVLWDCTEDRALQTTYIAPETVGRICDLVDPCVFPYLVYRDGAGDHDILVVSDDSFWHERDRLVPYLTPSEKYLKMIIPHSHTLVDRSHVLRIDFVAPKAAIRQLAVSLTENLGAAVTFSDPDPLKMSKEDIYLLHVSGRAISKWSGLAQICQKLDVAPSEVVAIGDGNLDLPVFEAIGCGIAMNDSEELLLQAAKHVTGSVEEDGAAQAIENILSGKWT